MRSAALVEGGADLVLVARLVLMAQGSGDCRNSDPAVSFVKVDIIMTLSVLLLLRCFDCIHCISPVILSCVLARIWSRPSEKILCCGSRQINENTAAKYASVACQVCEKS